MVGTGTSTVAQTDTQLQAQIAVSSTISSSTSRINSGSPLYETQHLFTFAFTQGAIVGNISEIGVGWDNTNCFSRALILDASGNPISITITEIDQLTVYYRLTVRPVLTDFSSTVTISGISYAYTSRVAEAGSFCDSYQVFTTAYSDGSNFSTTSASNDSSDLLVRGPGSILGTITTSGISGGTAGSSGCTKNYTVYSPGTYSRDSTINWSITQGNVTGGIQTISSKWSLNGSRYQWYFPTPLPKDNTKTMSLTFRFSWARL